MDYQKVRQELNLNLEQMATLFAVRNDRYIDDIERYKRYPSGPVATLYAIFSLLDNDTREHLKLMLLGETSNEVN